LKCGPVHGEWLAPPLARRAGLVARRARVCRSRGMTSLGSAALRDDAAAELR
jgi:hypothetical protein